jgi:hypothetical protein
MLGLPQQSVYDFKRAGIDRFVELLDLNDWRPFTPMNLFNKVDNLIIKRLGE